MANNLTIVISATDKATAVVRKVNDAMGRLTRPFDQVGKSFKSLGRELGFEKIGKNLTSIGRQASTAARSVGSIVAPMAALTGVASVAGVIALADGWANLGRSITYAAQNIGTGTGKLQAYEGAAKLAGIASGVMTSSLQTLGDTMEDALFGRNQQALMLFNRLGVGIKRTKDGTLDATAQFRALAGAIYRLKSPQQQNLAARQFGLSELLPLIRQGPAAFDRLTAKARELGMVMDGPALKSATDFATSIEGLQASGIGLRNSLGNAIIPAIKPLLDQLTTWVSTNRELISQKVGKWAQDFAKWITSVDWGTVGREVRGLLSAVGHLVDRLGGLKGVALVTGAVLGAGFVSNVVSLGLNLGQLAIGIGALIGKFTALKVAADAAGAATAASSTGALANLGRFGLVAGAAVGGVYVGSKISDAMEGTVVGDKFSHYNTKALGMALSAIGFKNNRFAMAARYDGYDQKYNGAAPVAGIDEGLKQRVVRYFQQQGWSPAQARGIAANLISESSLNPHATGDNGNAYGLAQWHADRQANFARYAGKPIQGSSLIDQLGFVQYELTRGSERTAGALLRSAKTAGEAGSIVSRAYERPADAQGAATSRAALAESLAAPTGPYAGGNASAGGTVHVEVIGKDLQPGTKLKATGQGAVTTSTRVGYSTIGANA